MKQRKKVLSTLLVLVMALSIMWAFAITVSAASYTGTVATGNSAPLNVRASASTSSALLGTINNGTVLAVTDYNTDWYQITFNGQTAYVMKQYISVNSGGGSTITGTVATGNSAPLNVRASASTSSTLLGTINNGTVLTLINYNTDWYQITFNGQIAYVMKQYITVGGSGGGSTITGTVATGNSAPLNVRASASTSSELLGTINNGTVLTLIDYNTDWYQITFNGQTAYVMKQYITVGGSGGGSGGTYTLVKPLAHGSTGANSTTDSGLDIFAAVGTDVYAAASGYIVYSEYGHTFCAPPTYPNDTPNSILIKLDDPITYNGRTAYYMWYTHLSSIVFNVKDGSALTTHVTAGQKIGASGIGANSAHLHFGIIINKAQSNSNDWFSPTEVRTLLGLTTNQNF